jgi:hypothetical protein
VNTYTILLMWVDTVKFTLKIADTLSAIEKNSDYL